MVIFHSFLYVYQRVPYVCPYFGGIYPPKFSPRTIGLKFRKVGTLQFLSVPELAEETNMFDISDIIHRVVETMS